MAASFFSYHLLRSQERGAAGAEFALASDSYVFAVRREIDANLKAIEVLRDYLETTREISPGAFGQFAASLRRQFPSLMVLEWAPLIAGNDRTQYEKFLATTGTPYPYIRSDLKIPPARARQLPEYLPLTILSPSAHTDQLLGYDLQSTAEVRRAMTSARQTHRLTAASPIRLIERMNDGMGVPIYGAVFDSRSPDHLRGLAMGIFQLATVLENGLRNARLDPANVAFWDFSPQSGARRIYFHGEDPAL
ncbi:MAG: CHASE domain-containing protein, partial [Acidobacteriota bacterium]|nr:CHASE domain-containing protein [Acidobacteriota bacterium]